MTDHALIEELLAVQALSGLDAQDEEILSREMARHGARCTECRRLERELGEVAGRLGLALDPVPVRDGLEDEVVSRATTTAHAPSRPAAPRRTAILRGAAAVAAAAVLFFGGWLVRDAATGAAPSFQGARVARFEGLGGELAMAWRPGEEGVLLVGSGFAELPAGRAYELWTFRGDAPVPSGCFTAQGGEVAELLEVTARPSDVMAVTIESSSCPGSPTRDPILQTEPLQGA